MKTAPKAVSLEMIAAKAGSKLDTSSLPLPTLDVTEVNKFDERKPARFLNLVVSCTITLIVVIVGVVFYIKYKKSKAVAALFMLFVLAGCEREAHPTVKLSVVFDKAKLIYDPNGDGGPSNITIRNAGNQTLTLLKVDGGCSCRRIGQEDLPVTLKPGATVILPVKFQLDATSYASRTYPLTVDTDRGPLSAGVNLTAIPRHRLDPGSIVNGNLDENAAWTFELTHRQTFEGDNPGKSTVLIPPPEFAVVKVGSQTGKVGAAPEFSYEDSSYRVTLTDRSMGAHRSSLRLEDPSRHIEIEIPIIWTRNEFLSSVPERVLLSAKSARVFLRCPDDSVELTKILSTPSGVKALVSSPREVTIALANSDVPEVNGYVEIATSDVKHPKLSIPVIKFKDFTK